MKIPISFQLLLLGASFMNTPSLAEPCCSGFPQTCGLLKEGECYAMGCYWSDDFCQGSASLCYRFSQSQKLCEQQGCIYNANVADCLDPSDIQEPENPFEEVAIDIGPEMAKNKRTKIALADLNGDGQIDLIAGGRKRLTSDGCLMTALNGNNGAFDVPQVLSSDPQEGFGRVRAIATGDLNGDGRMDIVVALQKHVGDLNDGAAILAYINNGNGEYSTSIVLPWKVMVGLDFEEIAARNVKIVDIDGDDSLDIVATIVDNDITDIFGNNDGPGRVLYFLNNGNGEFDAFTSLSDTLVGWLEIDVGDFDGDGNNDIVVVSKENQSVFVFYNDLPNGFVTTVIDNAAISTWAVTVGDVNMDSRLDIVSQGEESITLYKNIGNRGDFEKLILVDTLFSDMYDSIQPRKVMVRDIDGDGLNDIIHLRTPFDEIYWIRQTKSNPLTLDPYFMLKDISSYDFDIADINGDGIADLIVAADPSDGNVKAFLGKDLGHGQDPKTQDPGTQDPGSEDGNPLGPFAFLAGILALCGL